MQALKFIVDNWDSVAAIAVLVAAKVGLTKRKATKEQQAEVARLRAEAIAFIAKRAAQGVAALVKQHALKVQHAIQVWEVRVRELAETALVAIGGDKLSDEEWLKAREVASDFFEEVIVYAIKEDLTKAYQAFYASFNAHARQLERADAALIAASNDTARRRAEASEAKTRVQTGGGP
jgi:hypothetical protein